MSTQPKCVILTSGGLDSTVLLYQWLKQNKPNKPHCLGFNYGQKHLRELRFANATCIKLAVPYEEIELCRIKNLFLRCALTDGVGDVIVPNRNAVFLNIAVAIAKSIGARTVIFGATAEDYEKFPDCRQEWLDHLNSTIEAAEIGVRVLAPFIHNTKREIVEIGRVLGVPFEETTSCYNGTDCGKCLACKTRSMALWGSGIHQDAEKIAAWGREQRRKKKRSLPRRLVIPVKLCGQ